MRRENSSALRSETTALSLKGQMESLENANRNCDASYNALICQDDLSEADHPASPGNLKVSVPIKATSRHQKPTAVSLGLLAVILLAVDIGLAVHYKNLTDTHLTFEDVLLIKDDLTNLHDTYKTAIETTNEARKQLDKEINNQKEIIWELQHQTQRVEQYENQIAETQKKIAALKTHIPMTRDGCRYCLPGWILINSICYYFSSDYEGRKMWEDANESCKTQGGKLAIIDSKDKQNTTITYLWHLKKTGPYYMDDFWFGLRTTEGDWTWLDGTLLTEGYWIYRQSRSGSGVSSDCACVSANENIFRAWRNMRCDEQKRWICEMAPTSTS
ncbi:CD209 antigen-like [Thalassophryne amazonica]|uniref:CD209 antigen-like n=1 Tax=Thalassophryne amazonica TaxID=390379 RepID=UPI001470E117|nr:CD209 antigen-like [Thalassophryne amazonica]